MGKPPPKDRGQQGKGAPGKGGGRAPKRPDPVQVKAREIADQTGLPVYAALEVARGRWTIEHAFEQVRTKAEMHRLVREEGLSLSLAGQVVRGQISLEAAIVCARLQTDERVRGKRSVLDDAWQAGSPIAIAILDGERLVGRIVENVPYDLKLEVEGREPLAVRKHDLAFACEPGMWEAAQAGLGCDESVRALGLKGTEKVGDRLKVKNRDLFPLLSAGEPVRFSLRDGTTLTGVIKWFGRWEIGIELPDVGEIVAFRHALHAVVPAARA